VLPWIGVLVGLAAIGVGLLFAVFFGWTATHPMRPNDVEMGTFFSIASLVVCSGPGMLAAGFGAWRLFARRPGDELRGR
jgi:hypothetical protein